MGYRHAVLSLSAAVLIAPLAATGTAHASDGITQNAIGTYSQSWSFSPQKVSSKWVMTPCDDDAPRCVKVAQYWVTSKTPYVTGNAYWSVGSWIMELPTVKDEIVCKDSDQKFDYPATFSWDAGTNEGLRSYIDPGLCPGDENKGKDVSLKFTLTKVSSDTPAPPTPKPSPVPPPPAPSPVPPAPAEAPAPAPAPAAEAPAPPASPPPGAAESTAPPPAA